MSERVRKQDAVVKSYVRAGVGVLLAVALFLAGTINLESTPPLWWDEGWTLSVARNWVESGHYGRLLDGEPASPGLAAGFPVIAPIALSFRLLGVGIWQGRLLGVFFTLGALALIYYLARRLYDPAVAFGTLVVLLFLSPHPFIHSISIGRQALGEMPMLFYLLAGYACFLSAMRKSLWFMPVAVGFWGIALNTKGQVLPFWTVSLLVPLSIMLFRRKWKSASLIGIAFLGSLMACRLLLSLQQLGLRNHTIPATPIHGLYNVTAIVPRLENRLLALILVLMLGLPTLFALCYTIWRLIRNHDKSLLDLPLEIVRLALVALAVSWLGWYVSLSSGVIRYLFPPLFLGGIFVAALLYDLTDKFNLSSTIKRARHALRHCHLNRQSVGALLALFLIAVAPPATLRVLYDSYVIHTDISALQVAEFLNTQTAPDALVETYDSELFFLLDRRYHYPPDQISVKSIRRAWGDDVPIDYNPLAANPDYLVVGPFSSGWHIYDSVLSTGAFRFIHTYGRYDVYKRIR